MCCILQCYQLAALGGSCPEALLRLAHLHDRGKGIKFNTVESIRVAHSRAAVYYEKAVNQDVEEDRLPSFRASYQQLALTVDDDDEVAEDFGDGFGDLEVGLTDFRTRPNLFEASCFFVCFVKGILVER